jgi:Histidine kinase
VLAGIHPAFFSMLLMLYPQLIGGLLSVVFGSLFALWITRIIEQSYERRRLIEQLEETRSELAAAERDAGRLAERQRLARDIHDTLAQGFVSVVLQLQAAEADLPEGAVEARGHLERARRTARDNLAEPRRLVWDLRPEALSAAPLGEALGRLAGRVAEETGLAATGTVTGTAQAGRGRPHRRRRRGPGARHHRPPPARPLASDLTSAAPLPQALAVMLRRDERIRRDPVRRQRVPRRLRHGRHPDHPLPLQPGRAARGRRRPGPVEGQLRGHPGRGRPAGRDRGGRPGQRLPA